MLQLTNISKQFERRWVLNDFSSRVERGDFVVIMGSNGAGKSTLFDIISGKAVADRGTIHVEGRDITSFSERKRALFIGRLHQNTYLGTCPTLTVRENLALASLKRKRASFRKCIRAFPEKEMAELLKAIPFDLGALLDVRMGLLSGGQRQTIAFLMSLLHPPKLLLMDEPTSALDPQSATRLLLFAKEYVQKQEIPTLLITHDPMVAKHLGNRLWILEDGCIKREFGAEKQKMNPQDLFHSVDYQRL